MFTAPKAVSESVPNQAQRCFVDEMTCFPCLQYNRAVAVGTDLPTVLIRKKKPSAESPDRTICTTLSNLLLILNDEKLYTSFQCSRVLFLSPPSNFLPPKTFLLFC